MARGVIYVMSTVVPGLVKIGKTATSQFESRMYQLEHNGYFNVVGLKREFAIEVDDYGEKENLLDDIFSKARVHNSELFSLDVELVIQLLSSFEGTQIYPAPEEETKQQAFEKATEIRREHIESAFVPDGTYYLERKLKRNGNTACKATMVVEEGVFTIKAGQTVSPTEGAGISPGISQIRAAVVDSEGLVLEDVSFDTPSGAAVFVIGAAADGWTDWKTKSGQAIDCFRGE